MRHLPKLPAPLALIALLGSSAQTQVALNASGQTWLITNGMFSDLRWPDFSDYSNHVRKFYDFSGDSQWWVKGLEPTPQARQFDCTAAPGRPEGARGRRL